YKVKRTYKKEGDTEIIENEIEEGLIPLFRINLPCNTEKQNTKEQREGIYIYYRKDFCDYSPKISNNSKSTNSEKDKSTQQNKNNTIEFTDKNKLLEKVKEALNNSDKEQK
ncbi:MAG: hypothetical protein RMI30_04990, partial [Thermodesulfovibrio sp.]|nr:hypothetical protein [Thermodesulfovibrio sp.]